MSSTAVTPRLFKCRMTGSDAKPEKRAAQIRRHQRMERRHALDVQFVNHRLMPRRVRPIGSPLGRSVARLGHDAERRIGRAVGLVRRAVAMRASFEGVQRRMPSRHPANHACVGIEQDLGRIEPVAMRRRPRAVDPVAIVLPGTRIRQIGVPDAIGALAERHARRFELCTRAVEQAEVHGGRVLGKEREVHARAVPRRAEWRRCSWPHPHAATFY